MINWKVSERGTCRRQSKLSINLKGAGNNWERLKVKKLITEDECGPVVHASLQAFVEDLVEEEDRLRVEENGADVLVRARRPE